MVATRYVSLRNTTDQSWAHGVRQPQRKASPGLNRDPELRVLRALIRQGVPLREPVLAASRVNRRGPHQTRPRVPP